MAGDILSKFPSRNQCLDGYWTGKSWPKTQSALMTWPGRKFQTWDSQKWTSVEATPGEEQRYTCVMTQQACGNVSETWGGEWEEGQENKGEERGIWDCSAGQVSTWEDQAHCPSPLQNCHPPFCLGCSWQCTAVLPKPEVIRAVSGGRNERRSEELKMDWGRGVHASLCFPVWLDTGPHSHYLPPFPFHFQYYRYFFCHIKDKNKYSRAKCMSGEKVEFYANWGVRLLYQSQNV